MKPIQYKLSNYWHLETCYCAQSDQKKHLVPQMSDRYGGGPADGRVALRAEDGAEMVK